MSASPVVINRDTLTIEAYVMNDQNELRTKRSKNYHWYKGGKILITKGGMDGRALHGPFTSFYRDRNLSEKGQFKKGLRVGKWSRWWEDGMIKQVCRYRSGKRHGQCFNYATNGDLVSIIRYKRGIRTGWSSFYDDNALIHMVKYRKGEEIKRKDAPEEKKEQTSEDKAQKKRIKTWMKGLKKKQPEELEPSDGKPKDASEQDDGSQS